jgi:hypothetical protein
VKELEQVADESTNADFDIRSVGLGLNALEDEFKNCHSLENAVSVNESIKGERETYLFEALAEVRSPWIFPVDLVLGVPIPQSIKRLMPVQEKLTSRTGSSISNTASDEALARAHPLRPHDRINAQT